MIIEKTVELKVNVGNIKYIRNRISDAKLGDIVIFNVEHLPHGSHVYITANCECGKTKHMTYKNYNKCISKYNYYVCSKCRYIKMKKTNLEKYGVENVMKVTNVVDKMKNTNFELYGCVCTLHNIDVKSKSDKSKMNNNSFDVGKKTRKKTCLIKYGVDNVMKDLKINLEQRKTMLKLYGVENPSYNVSLFKQCLSTKVLTEFQKYRRMVTSITNKNKKKLFETWNGYDYYDNEYIFDHFKYHYLSNNYPSIDHKISVIYGFTNNMCPEDIGNILNLCITKRGINCTKHRKTESEYLKIKKDRI